MRINIPVENLVPKEEPFGNSCWCNLTGLKAISLEEDIRANGVKVDLQVIALGNGMYKIKDGHHRYLFGMKCGIKSFWCDVIG